MLKFKPEVFMKEFYVQMPIAGMMACTVQATTKEEAIEKFYEKTSSICFDDESVSAAGADIEWDCHPHMLQGNVRSFKYNNVEVEEV